MTSAVRDAVDSVLIPALRKLREDIPATNNSVGELREEFEAIATAAKQTRDRVDSVRADTREDRNAVTDLRNQLERLTRRWQIWRIKAGEITYDWWSYQRGWRDLMWLVSSELIFPGGFLPWEVVTSRLTRHTAYMMEGKTPIGRVLSSSVCWDGMTDWRFWKVLGRLIKCGKMHAGQCHATIFSWL